MNFETDAEQERNGAEYPPLVLPYIGLVRTSSFANTQLQSILLLDREGEHDVDAP